MNDPSVLTVNARSGDWTQTRDTDNPGQVLDFNDGPSDSVAGIQLVPAVGPTIDFEG